MNLKLLLVHHDLCGSGPPWVYSQSFFQTGYFQVQSRDNVESRSFIWITPDIFSETQLSKILSSPDIDVLPAPFQI